ncbi:MAG: cytochrome c biogenesis protein [Symbiobacteriia bacterium]
MPQTKGPARATSLLGLISAAAVLFALALVFLWVPPEQVMGDVQRIFYFHVASAWNAFLAFAVVFIASIGFLRSGSRRWDSIAYCSAEIGVVFTTITLITGPIWARPIWNTWWTWDPRLTTTLILWFIYIAYLVIRASAESSQQQARLAAVFGIIGFVDVPIVFMSTRWWRSIHPTLIQADKMNMAGSMVLTMIVSVIAFTLLYAFLLNYRLRLETLGQRLEVLKRDLRR